MTEVGHLTPVAQSKGRASQLVGAMGSTPEILGEVGFFFSEHSTKVIIGFRLISSGKE